MVHDRGSKTAELPIWSLPNGNRSLMQRVRNGPKLFTFDQLSVLNFKRWSQKHRLPCMALVSKICNLSKIYFPRKEFFAVYTKVFHNRQSKVNINIILYSILVRLKHTYSCLSIPTIAIETMMMMMMMEEKQ